MKSVVGHALGQWCLCVFFINLCVLHRVKCFTTNISPDAIVTYWMYLCKYKLLFYLEKVRSRLILILLLGMSDINLKY